MRETDMIWLPSALYGLLAAVVGVAGHILVVCTLRGWDQLDQPQFWVEGPAPSLALFSAFSCFLPS
jgi:hypothetical protein